MKRKILYLLIIVGISFYTGYELGNSKITDFKFSKSYKNSACPYLNENSSAKQKNNCPYLNKESESKCPYLQDDVQKSGIKIKLSKIV